MNQTQDLLRELKKCLRAKGLAYRDLAMALKISESSVKRIFSQKSFTLARLEQVCRFLDMSIYRRREQDRSEQGRYEDDKNDEEGRYEQSKSAYRRVRV